jgi:hypothetical protein
MSRNDHSTGASCEAVGVLRDTALQAHRANRSVARQSFQRAKFIKYWKVSNIDQRLWNPKIMLVPSPPLFGIFR